MDLGYYGCACMRCDDVIKNEKIHGKRQEDEIRMSDMTSMERESFIYAINISCNVVFALWCSYLISCFILRFPRPDCFPNLGNIRYKLIFDREL